MNRYIDQVMFVSSSALLSKSNLPFSVDTDYSRHIMHNHKIALSRHLERMLAVRTLVIVPETVPYAICETHSPDTTVNIAHIVRYLCRRGSYIPKHLRPVSRGRLSRCASACHGKHERGREKKRYRDRRKKNEIRRREATKLRINRDGTRCLTDV